ncbi:protein MTSS 2 isoform X1 [Peromyscus leucopus]|uniref:protein MTSS 2 isoform X1 n=1 Tax=Peromyscus leucopus TaxID=10041 RepID=UPI00042AA1DF|nr:protein MTSS 2 isoform X1 [Peromyscus maniculatus bairdii]XP_028746912.1 protein MTSS 2 isoform X1 [Peromyscus leucopus]
METAEKECGALGGLFQAIVNDMKSSYPIWEDFNSKAAKLHSQLRTTVLAAVAFLDAFQKVADMATNTRGATRDIGSALTRMCMRHRSIETKLRQFTNALLESLINPLQERIEDWKKSANQLDKDHAKEYKRARHEIKKKSSDTLKLQKKARKELLGKGDLQPQLDSALQDVNDMYLLLEETEKQAVRRALIEERGRFCTFITFLQPVVNGELTMLGEITHLQGIIDDLVVLTAEPHKLPPASEQVIKDLKGSDYSWSYQTPPSSPSSSSSRKSSMCSAPSSSAKGGGAPWPGGAQTYSPSSTCRYRSLAQPAATRLSSVSSHDSGFVSQDATYSKPPSPMPSDITSQKSSSSASSEASETCQSVSECSSPTSDWTKAGPHEQPPSATTLQRRKDRVELLRDTEPGPTGGGTVGSGGEEVPRPRMSPATIAAKHGEEVSPAASDLAMVLTRGLSLEHQKSSRDSLQYSSGYSTQTTTPSCSEDTIPSQGSDYDCYSVNGDADSEGPPEFDKSSTIPRNSNIAQNYRRLIQTKRPASTAGLPTAGLPTAMGLPSGAPPGVATIRRTPSTKPTVRRALSSAGPIPIRPPIVPVKTPTVPDSPGYVGPTRAGSEECVFYTDDVASPLAPDLAKASPKRLSLPNTAWGSPTPEAASYSGAGVGLAAEDDEEQQLAANRHSLVEKLGELVAGAHALGEGQFPFPTALSATPAEETPTPPPAATSDPPAEDMLVAIRRGVRLRRTVTNDRSAPRIL